MIASNIDRLYRATSTLAFVRRNRFHGAHEYTFPFTKVADVLYCPLFNRVLSGSATDFDDAGYGDVLLAKLQRARSFNAPWPRLRVMLEAKFKSHLQAKLREHPSLANCDRRVSKGTAMSDVRLPGLRRLFDGGPIFADGIPACSLAEFALKPSYGPRSAAMKSQVDDFAERVMAGERRLGIATAKRHLVTEAFEGRLDVKMTPGRLFAQWVKTEIDRRSR